MQKQQLKCGLYIIFEGNDLTGKSTSMKLVIQRLHEKLDSIFSDLIIHETHHPGSTPLGQHLRKLIRHPEEINSNIIIDHLSRQVLHLADAASFKSILEPALEAKQIVFADRSFYISSLAYGYADGVPLEDLARLYDVITPPRADRLYIFQCPLEVTQLRITDRDNRDQDRYDKLPYEFHQKVNDTYDNLATGSQERTMLVSKCVALDNIIYVDASASQDAVVDFVVDDLLQVLVEREHFKF